MAELRQAPDTLQAMFDRLVGRTRKSHPAMRIFSDAVGDVERGVIDPMFRQTGRDVAKAAVDPGFGTGGMAALSLIGLGIGGPGGKAGIEFIRGAAIKIGNKIFRGANHGEALDFARRSLPKGTDLSDVQTLAGKNENIGYVTSEGRFITRKEATDVAEKARQLPGGGKPDIGIQMGGLHSTDITPPPQLTPIQGGRAAEPRTFEEAVGRGKSKTERLQTTRETGKVPLDPNKQQTPDELSAVFSREGMEDIKGNVDRIKKSLGKEFDEAEAAIKKAAERSTLSRPDKVRRDIEDLSKKADVFRQREAAAINATEKANWGRAVREAEADIQDKINLLKGGPPAPINKGQANFAEKELAKGGLDEDTTAFFQNQVDLRKMFEAGDTSSPAFKAARARYSKDLKAGFTNAFKDVPKKPTVREIVEEAIAPARREFDAALGSSRYFLDNSKNISNLLYDVEQISGKNLTQSMVNASTEQLGKLMELFASSYTLKNGRNVLRDNISKEFFAKRAAKILE